MSFWSRFGSSRFRKNVSCLAVLISSTAVTVILFVSGAKAGSSFQGDRIFPTFYYYQGRPFQLNLEPGRLAVRFRTPMSEAAALSPLANLGLQVTKSEPTGVAQWFLLTVSDRAADPADADMKIRRLLASPNVEFAAPVFQGLNGNWVTVTPDILLRFKPQYWDQADRLLPELAPELAVVTKDFGRMPGAYKLGSGSPDGFEVLSSANRLAGDSRIEWAEPDAQFSGTAALVPNDPLFPNLWGILNTGQFGGTPGRDMDGDSAWDIQTGSASIKVLILDVGVQQDHPDINQLPGADFTGEGGGGGPVNACDNHGTAVAGCVSGIINNSLGIAGIAPGCKVLSARPFTATLDCSGNWTSQASWTVDALTWGDSLGARVSNNSNIYGFTSSAIDAKYNSTYSNGMVHFAAAGNFSSSFISYPASIPIVNAVAALQPNGTLASFSNHGNGLDFSGPGQTIYSTDRTGGDGYVVGDYVIVSGTSFASPYCAGVAALVLSQNPGLTSAQVEDIMHCSSQDLGTTGYDTTYGWGLVNAEHALLNTPESDQDADGVADQCDICPTIANPLQQNIKPGDANASGTHSLSDIIALVNYIFNKPGFPACASNATICWLSDLLCRGDWDGSGTATLSDVIRGVNYIFGKPGGPWNPLPSGICCVPVP